MSKPTLEEIAGRLERMASSGNGVPVERVVLAADEARQISASLRELAEWRRLAAAVPTMLDAAASVLGADDYSCFCEEEAEAYRQMRSTASAVRALLEFKP